MFALFVSLRQTPTPTPFAALYCSSSSDSFALFLSLRKTPIVNPVDIVMLKIASFYYRYAEKKRGFCRLLYTYDCILRYACPFARRQTPTLFTSSHCSPPYRKFGRYRNAAVTVLLISTISKTIFLFCRYYQYRTHTMLYFFILVPPRDAKADSLHLLVLK